MLKALLALLGTSPKTLDQARAPIDSAKSFAESVNTLFVSAGLNLETMLAAGPDSLKAHLAGLEVKAEEFSALTTKLTEAQSALTTAQGALTAAEGRATEAFAAHDLVATAIGLPARAAGTAPTAAATKTAFEAHVEKATTLKLAKGGHPPVHHIDPDAPESSAANAGSTAAADDAHLKAYEALSADRPARFAYYDKHEAAILRASDRRAKASRNQ